jgi:ATP-dependent DNA helicase RecQ
MIIPIFTIGYGKQSGDEFVALLKQHAIQFLIDVRSAPYSRYKPEFSKDTLADMLREQGIRYVFMGNLLGGRPDDPDCYTNGRIDYERIKTMPFYQQGIARLQTAFEQQHRVAIMCSEGKPQECHRTLLIGQTLTELGVPLCHIDENGELHSQEAVLARLGQKKVGKAGDTPMAKAQQLLHSIYGYETFRPLQAEIISNVLEQRDTLVIMPTGGGKSLCYQLPALLLEGMTLVVSPLISLMQDQVDQLRELGITAVYLNSSLSLDAYYDTLAQVRQGHIKLLYMAPETLLKPDILDTLTQCNIDCLAIDEAHCISAWGHDFRPEYRQLVEVRQRLPTAVCVALTATATPRVQDDIKSSLNFQEENAFVASFNRDNLFLEVVDKVDAVGQALEYVAQHPNQSGIIYCATRRQVDALTHALSRRGLSVLPYHAGLDSTTRQLNQTRFVRDDVEIIIATIAFGMGIDKPNVRFILHVDLPSDIENYYQQIGRAGRDGLPANCRLLFNYSDIYTIKHFIGQAAEEEQRGRQLRLEALVGWAETRECRRKPLLSYFGETFGGDNCGQCDNCTREEKVLVDITVPAQKFLSCVKRTGELFGASHIINVLRGSRAKSVLERRHDRLSTYNIGTEFSQQQWRHLGRQLVQQGLLTQDMEYGSLKLTAEGWAVLNGAQAWGVLEEERQRTAVSPAREALAYDAGLYELLRQKRKELADAANVPPYIIFSDRSLVEMATYFPHSQAALGQLYGIGEVKVANYAGIVLPIIAAYCQANGLREKPKQAAQPERQRVGSRNGRSRSDEVGEAFADGQTVEELQQVYNVKRGTIISHLARYVQSGNALSVESLFAVSALTSEQQEHVWLAFAEHGIAALRPIFEACGEQIPYDELHLLRLCYQLETDNT